MGRAGQVAPLQLALGTGLKDDNTIPLMLWGLLGHMFSDSVSWSCQTDRSELDVNTVETKINWVDLLEDSQWLSFVTCEVGLVVCAMVETF